MSTKDRSSHNQLGNEKSPYLLQHKDNPVDWYAWSDAAFQKAVTEDKPILLSIGYSTCYWCHVMEQDSFENEEVAAALNASYVSIKVDREEHPEVDQIYMEAVVALTGHGGWPMTVFLTPEKKPFFGGTFFPRPQFLELLGRVSEFWKNHREELNDSANKITRVIAAHVAGDDKNILSDELFAQAFEKFAGTFDPEFGGFGEAPKFPPHSGLPFLFRHAQRVQSASASHLAEFTLSAMAQGGIFDHIGGGFHRYSTDREWLVPHFEKMLYDNALLATNYCTAYRATSNEMFREVAVSTLDYLTNEMLDPVGGFHSAEDAGEVGDEGAFYTWTRDELDELLDPVVRPLFFTVFGVTERGQFEGRNVLAIRNPYAWGIRRELQPALDTLRASRATRLRPHRDDKILTGWNGLAIEALSNGFQITGNTKYLTAAQNCATFLRSKMWVNNILLRRYRDGESRFNGSLEDYAYLISGLIALYQSDFDTGWITFAIDLQNSQDSQFLDSNRGGYFYASPKADVLFRRKDFVDSATPSPNAVSARNLLSLFHFTGDLKFRSQAEQLIQLGANEVERYPTAFGTLLQAYDFLKAGGSELVVASSIPANTSPTKEIFAKLWSEYLPNTLLGFTTGEATFPALLQSRKPGGNSRKEPGENGDAMFYVCRDMRCDAPTVHLDEALTTLKLNLMTTST